MARMYDHEGVKKASVTTITGQLDKPALTYWSAGCTADYIIQNLPANLTIDNLMPVIERARKDFRKVSSTALDIGSAVHEAVERYLSTGKEPQAPSDEVLSAFMAFLEWHDRNPICPIETEYTVYGPDYAGTCDLIGMLRGKKYVVDFKASKGIYPEMRYQIAAYRATDPTIEGCGILRLDKETGLPEWRDTSDTYEEDIEIFLLLKDLWYARNKKYPKPKGEGKP
jgi:hypothetical protein